MDVVVIGRGEVEGDEALDSAVRVTGVEAVAVAAYLLERYERSHVAIDQVEDFLRVDERFGLRLVICLAEHGVHGIEGIDFDFERVGLAMLDHHFFISSYCVECWAHSRH